MSPPCIPLLIPPILFLSHTPRLAAHLHSLCRFIHCVSPKLCPKDKWLFIKYPGKTRELILASYPSYWERERNGGEKKEEGGREVYGGKVAKHPSAFNSMNWINTENRVGGCRPACACEHVCVCMWTNMVASCQTSRFLISTTHSEFHLSPFLLLLLLPLPLFISHRVFGLFSNGCRPRWN